MALAKVLRRNNDIAALILALGSYSQNIRDFSAAMKLFESLADHYDELDDQEGATVAYHQLGRTAQEQRDFAAAETWYKKSLAIKEKLGNEHGAATTYHQLGIIAEEQRDFAAAETWYKKSLAIKEKQGNEHGAASTYHQLGNIAQEQHDFSTAGEWFLKAIVNFSTTNDQHYLGIAISSYLHNLQAADAATRSQLKNRWRETNLNQLAPINELEKQFNDNQTIT